MNPTNIILSQLIGLFGLITSLSLLLRRKMLTAIFHDLYKTRALSYIWGVLLLVFGLTIVLMHNLWTNPQEIVVSAVGWYVLIEAAMYLFLPQKFMRRLFDWVQNTLVYYAITVFHLALGTYLVYVGFLMR